MLKNIGSNWVLAVVTIAVTYVLTPFILHTLGQDGYGTWLLIASITGYLNLLVLGVPMASVRYFAEYGAQENQRKLNEALGSCMGLFLMMGAAALVFGAGLFAFFDLTYDIPAALRGEARLAFGLLVLYVSAGFVGILPQSIMAAHHDFVLRNSVVIGVLLLRFGLTVWLLTLNASMVVLALIQIGCLALDFSVSWVLIRQRYARIRMRLADFDWAMVRRIFSFSVYVLLLNLGTRLTFQTDSMVIGAFLDVGRIPFYTVANNVVWYLMDFVIAIASVVMPMATRLKTLGRVSEIEEIFLRWSKIAFSLTLMAGFFFIVLGPRFIGRWVGPAFEGPAGEVLQILMVSSLVFFPVRGVAVPTLMGVGKPGLPTIAFLAAGLLNLGLSLLLVRPLGLVGVALGTAIPNVIFALVVLILACRELQISLSRYVRYVVLRPVLGSFPILALLLWFKLEAEIQGLLGLAGAGLIMVLLFGVIWVFFVYRNDPSLDRLRWRSRLLAWSKTWPAFS